MITISDCRRVVGEHYKITREVMQGTGRKRKFARPRQMAMTLAREFTGASYPKISASFGRRDHTTAIHALHRIRDLEKINPEVRDAMEGFRSALETIKALRILEAEERRRASVPVRDQIAVEISQLVAGR